MRLPRVLLAVRENAAESTSRIPAGISIPVRAIQASHLLILYVTGIIIFDNFFRRPVDIVEDVVIIQVLAT